MFITTTLGGEMKMAGACPTTLAASYELEYKLSLLAGR